MGNTQASGSSSGISADRLRTVLESYVTANFKTRKLVREGVWVLPFGGFDILLTYNCPSNVFTTYAILDDKVDFKDATKITTLIRQLDTLNFTLVLGNFELDLSDGQIRFKICTSSMDLKENEFRLFLSTATELCIQTMNKELKGIQDIIKAPTAPVAFSPPPVKKTDTQYMEKKMIAQDVRTSSEKNEVPAAAAIGQPQVNAKGSNSNVIDDYLIDAASVTDKIEVGRGASAVVYKGMWNGTPVAFKELTGLVGADVSEDFKREFQTMLGLRHPNVILLLGASTDPKLSLVMEYLEGGSLSDLVHKSDEFKKYSQSQKLNLAIQIARGMTYVHFRKLVHGDLKPANVMLDVHRTAKIVDFGLARFRTSAAATSTMTVIQGSGFSPAYAAPELFSHNLSEASDVYALGIILWEVMFQKIPFYGEHNPFVLAVQIMGGLTPTIPAQHSIDMEAVDLMKSCWLKEPKDRPKMAAVLSNLEKINTRIK